MNGGDLAFACASLLIDELARGGVRDVCVSPGSRSAPLALAAARHGGLRVHVILDERSAGYFAMGLAKASGVPATLICTSGTAAVNYHPAVVEARWSRTPLIVLTADRPPEARQTGTNQTIDQTWLYGSAPLWFFETPLPAVEAETARTWRSVGSRAAAAAAGPPAGPVHLNVPFREPLIPTDPVGSAVDLGPDSVGRLDGSPWERTTPLAPAPGDDAVDELAALVDATERGVIVAGGLDRPAPALVALASRCAWPLIAEPQSQMRTVPALSAPQFLLSRFAPDVVLYAGAPPTTRATRAFLESAGRVITVDAFAWSDPDRRSSWIVRADPQQLAGALLSRIASREGSPWLDSWRLADERAREAIDTLIGEWEQPFEGRIARDVAFAVPEGGILAIGSSMPVRDLDMFMAPRDGIRVIGNRGASGIDGFVSTVLGLAAASPASSVVALMGDLTFLHDAGSLAWLVPQSPPAVLVVVNNGGGGIFEFLPQATLPEHESLFATPHTAQIEAIARAADAEHRLVQRAGNVAAAAEDALRSRAVTVLEVPASRGDNTKRHAMVADAVDRALGAS